METPVLIIDDDEALCDLLGEYLSLQGFAVTALHDGAEAVNHLERNDYAVLVLDIMLPGMQGLDVLRRIRERSNTPVLMLTAKGEDTDRIVGLELGADDYLPKPCNPRELSARLRAILRRASGAADTEMPELMEVNDTRLHRGDRSASHAGTELHLTSAEFNLLQILMSHAGHAVDKDTLSSEGLGRPLSAYDRSIDVHVSKIRKKLAEAGGNDLIISVRGQGYQFCTGSSREA